MNQNPNPGQYPQSPQPRTVQVAVPNVKPYVTYSILGFTVFVYLLQLAGEYLLPASLVNSLTAPFSRLLVCRPPYLAQRILLRSSARRLMT